METLALLYLLGAALAAVLIICWVVLPFAVIGVKPLLTQVLEEQRRTNDLLEHAVLRRKPGPGEQ